MRARFLAGAGLIGLIAALWLAAAAPAATTTIGKAAPSSGVLTSGSPGFVVIQTATDPASPSFVVPQVPTGAGPWSVVSWGARGRLNASSASLEIWRPTSTSGEYRLIAIGPEEAFPPTVLTVHAVNIPVLPGDHLGTRSGNDSDFGPQYSTGLIGDVWIGPQGSPTVGQTTGGPSSDFPPPVFTGSDFRANVQATLSSTPAVAAPTPTIAAPTTTAKKCKKKKHKRSAESAKKKCRKHKKK
jgi:hypothetical protein